MFAVQLDCGRVVDVNLIQMQRGRFGWEVYGPSLVERANQHILQLARVAHEKTLGPRNFYLIPPVLTDDPEFPHYPDVYIYVWLYCEEPVKGRDCDGSQLVVGWFENLDPGKPLREIVSQAVKSVPWEDFAGDFLY